MTRNPNAPHNRPAKRENRRARFAAHGHLVAEANEYWRSPDDSFYLLPVNPNAPKAVRRKRVYLAPEGK